MARDHLDTEKVPQAICEAIPAPADIMLTGQVNDDMVTSFQDQLEKARKKDADLVVCCSTSGGDAEMVRRIALELERLQDDHSASVFFLGKSTVYSAGMTIMAAFPVQRRYLTRDTILLIHGRQLTQTVELDGPIRLAKPRLEALIHEIETGLILEEDGFRKLIEGSALTLDEVSKKAAHNWYVTASEAKRLSLVAALV